MQVMCLTTPMKTLALLAALLGSAHAVSVLPTHRDTLLREPLLSSFTRVSATRIPGPLGSTATESLRGPDGQVLTLNLLKNTVTSATLITPGLTTAQAFTGLLTDNSDLLKQVTGALGRGQGTYRNERFQVDVTRTSGTPPMYRVEIRSPVQAPTRFSADAPLVQRGKPGAGVINVYTDYGCPYCQEWATTALPYWKQTHPNVTIRAQAAPNERTHPGSTRAALYALCVSITAPRAFDAFETALYARRDWRTRTPDAALLRAATLSGASRQNVLTCVTSPAAKAAVQTMQRQARALNVPGTPTVYVNGVAMQRWWDMNEFKTLLSINPFNVP